MKRGIPSRYLTKAGRHPLAIKPLGNYYVDMALPDFRDSRSLGLGSLAVLPDEILHVIFAELPALDLGRLSRVSKAMLCWSRHDEYWKYLVITKQPSFEWHGSTWKESFIFNYCNRMRSVQLASVDVQYLYSDFLFQSWFCSAIAILPEWLVIDNIDRVSGISVDEFISRYESTSTPVIIQNAMDNWPALKNWTPEYLCSNYGDVTFRAEAMDTPLANYFKYASTTKEETPMYLFDKFFPKNCPDILDDFSAPPFFDRDDLFRVLGEDKRPDYRWIIIGPEKSGSSFHVDPNATGAWNATIYGSKKWIMYPPNVVPPGVFPSEDLSEVATPASVIEWFLHFYKEAQNSAVKPIECVTRPGDIIFVPSGWWHSVINLEMTIAITQNYVSRSNLTAVLDFLRCKKDQISGLDECNEADTLGMDFENSLVSLYPELEGDVKSRKRSSDHEKSHPSKKRVSFWGDVTKSEEPFSVFSIFQKNDVQLDC